jgi:thiol:disulfide interchange protein DsbA
MKRRTFSAATLAGCLGAAAAVVATHARAQGGQPVEGTHYVRLTPPVPTGSPGKIEVLEFFWYGCPHCNAFEPELDAWARRLPADVAFRRVPTAFSANWVAHQRLYYALEALGLLDTVHRRVFYAIHHDRQRLDQPRDIAEFVSKNGIDPVKFGQAYDSFGVIAKTRQASALVDAYKIDAVPAIGVQGRYYTSGTLAGSNDRSLRVADFLIERIRKGG